MGHLRALTYLSRATARVVMSRLISGPRRPTWSQRYEIVAEIVRMQFAEASNASIQAAAASAEWGKAKDFYLVVTNAPGDEAWPIAATNFILMSKQPKNAAGNKAAREFFDWVYENGDESATQLGYVPLPDALVEQIEAYWAANFK